ncbi:MAG: DUF971 domain-containing protein [Acidobacteria bacterium]|nr:DUF971 domain-containing protein [Acidobacteriota bacterium]
MPNYQPLPAAAEHIAVSRSKGIGIDWRGGHHSAYPLAYLRDHCPCATCTGAHGTVPRKTDLSTNPFQLYKPALRMVSVEPVGNYALRIDWNDGHNSGIYSYDYLREICPCDECASRRATGGGN